jgi:hypothetical protein
VLQPFFKEIRCCVIISRTSHAVRHVSIIGCVLTYTPGHQVSFDNSDVLHSYTYWSLRDSMCSELVTPNHLAALFPRPKTTGEPLVTNELHVHSQESRRTVEVLHRSTTSNVPAIPEERDVFLITLFIISSQ